MGASPNGSTAISGSQTTSCPAPSSASARCSFRPSGRVRRIFTGRARQARRRALPDPLLTVAQPSCRLLPPRARSESSRRGRRRQARGSRPPPSQHTRAPPRLAVVGMLDELLVSRSNLESQRTLARLGQELVGVEAEADLVLEPEPV